MVGHAGKQAGTTRYVYMVAYHKEEEQVSCVNWHAREEDKAKARIFGAPV